MTKWDEYLKLCIAVTSTCQSVQLKEKVDSLFHEGENTDPACRCSSDQLSHDEQAQDRKALCCDEFELHSKHARASGAQHI